MGAKCLKAVEGMFVTCFSASKRAILTQECASYARRESTHSNTTSRHFTTGRRVFFSRPHTPCDDPPVWLAQCRHHRSLWLKGIDLPLAGPSANAAAALAPGRLARCTGECAYRRGPFLSLSRCRSRFLYGMTR